MLSLLIATSATATVRLFGPAALTVRVSVALAVVVRTLMVGTGPR